MKRKMLILSLTALSMVMSLTACGNKNAQTGTNCVEGCSCKDCVYCTDSATRDDAEPETNGLAYAEESSEVQTQIQTEEEATQEETITGESTQTEQETESETQTQELNEIQRLTEGEKAARREQQQNFDEARQGLYTLTNSKDKTSKINQMDRQILANNSYDFSDKNILFIGDSITEGITSAVDQNGNFISYVTYANSYLHFNEVLNHSKGGRMFSTYGGEELSIAENFDNVSHIGSDIIVVFAGINDYLTEVPNKRFGNIEDNVSTAGFCGALRDFMNQLSRYCSDSEIFFVTMYDVSRTPNCTYSDYNGQPDLGVYMDAERKLAEEYGFNIIELYDIGFMDCSDKESSDYYLRDGLHPKDNGNIVLGEHIAAELSLYFSQKTE